MSSKFLPIASSQKPICLRPHIIDISAADAVDHRDVDHLALARALRFEDAADEPEGHEHPAAAEVADEVDRRRRLAAGPTEVRERARERDVVDVVTGGLRHRAVLAPPGHPAVDELGIAGETVVGTEPEPLGDAGPVALEERVRLLDEPEHELDALGILEVDTDRAPPAVERLEVRLVERRPD